MVLSLLRLLGSSYKGRDRHDNWELIGQETHLGILWAECPSGCFARSAGGPGNTASRRSGCRPST